MAAIKIIQTAENRYRIRAGYAMHSVVTNRFGTDVRGTIETLEGDLVPVKFDWSGWETNRPL